MTGLDELAGRVEQGEPLGAADAAIIAASHDLVAIGMLSDEVRRQMHGTYTTFVRVFEVHADAIPSSAPADLAAGEVRIVGRPASLDAAVHAVASARLLTPAPLFGFALHELEPLGSPDTTFARLKAAGLDGIAELAVDSTLSAAPLVRAARRHGLLVCRATVHQASDDLVGLLTRARELFSDFGGIQAFAPLPRQLSVANPTTGYDDVKAVSLARLLIRDVPSVQVDWPLYGPKLAQVGLIVGADDVDGVSPLQGGPLGARRSALEEIRGNIRAAGLKAVERNGRFEPVRDGGDGADE